MKKPYETNLSLLDEMLDKWPSPFVARAELPNFTGGILNPRTEANKESRGDDDAIPNRFRIQRKIFYICKDVVATLKRRMSNEHRR